MADYSAMQRRMSDVRESVNPVERFRKQSPLVPRIGPRVTEAGEL